MLPGTVGVVDPLHSTGIAHALSGVQRLARILLHEQQARAHALARYSTDVVDEVVWIDRIVSTCYTAASRSFDLFVAACSLYFVAAIHCERQLLRASERARTGELTTNTPFDDGFLLKNNTHLRRVGHSTEQRIAELRPEKEIGGASSRERREVVAWLREQLTPWNDVGLMDESLMNRIARSTAEKLIK